MKNRIFLLFLTFAAPLILFACGEKESGGNAAKEMEKTESIEYANKETTEEAVVLPEVKEGDFDGYDFRFMTKSADWGEWQTLDLYAEKENGETINDAVYRRNTILEEKFNITISEIGVNSPHGDAKRIIKAGDDSFDAVTSGMSEIVLLSQEGLLLDLNNLPGVDLSNKWWDQKGVSELEMGGRLFCATGDLFITDKDATWVMMFNKKLAQEYGLEDPYALVLSGGWTIDKFDSIIKNVSGDLNGDGTMNENDLYGFSTHEYSSWGFLYGSGIKIAEKDATGYPALVMNSALTSAVMEKTVATMTNGLYTYCVPVGSWAKALKIFEEDRAVFYGEVLQCAIRLRQMETNFGLIPYPKYNAEQTAYPCMVNAVAAVIAVPATCKDKGRSGAILEYMSYLSEIYLKPAYYEVALKGKFMRDEESGEMLDLIMRDRVFDLGYIFDWGSLGSSYCSTVMKKSADFTSLYEKGESKARAAIDKLIEAYENFD